MMFISVDLPEPDAPMMATNSPLSMVRLTFGEHSQRLAARRIGAADRSPARGSARRHHRASPPAASGRFSPRVPA